MAVNKPDPHLQFRPLTVLGAMLTWYLPMLKAKTEAPDDLNPQETSEWVEALDEIIDEAGPDRAGYLLETLMERAANLGVPVPLRRNTAYMNTILPKRKPLIRETGSLNATSRA